MESEVMPPKVLLTAVIVLIFTIFCFVLSGLLLYVLWRGKELYTYVWLIAVTTLLNTLDSLLQEAYYIARYQESVTRTYEASVRAYNHPSLALGPLTTGFEAGLYWILFYIYNVQALLFLFWALSLACTVWQVRLPRADPERVKNILNPVSKAAAFVLPAITSACHSAFQYRVSFQVAQILTNILFVISFTLGALSLLAIIFKYLQLRRRSDNHRATSLADIFGSNLDDIASPIREGRHVRQRSRIKVRVDSLLLLRFFIAFIILLAFEAYLFVYSARRYHRVKSIAQLPGPDFSVKSSIVSSVNYIPGVTSSLLAFFLFGTSRTHRELYAKWMRRALCLSPEAASRRGTVVSLRTLRFMSRAQSTPGPVVIADPELAMYETAQPVPKVEGSNVQIASTILVTERTAPT